ncbi:hypothetical protein [Shinella sumterensis]|uniref:hypothetical protein n=1 Tax=Shinella sumterensis TaxID=1967501 RepID=UPI003F8524BD
MIDFNQYAAKRLLLGYVSLALDGLENDQIVPQSDMKQLLGSRFAAYETEFKTDITPSVSEQAKGWNERRTTLMREITLAENSKRLTRERPRNAKETALRRKFNAEAEKLLEAYREYIEHTTDHAAFINYESSFEAPFDEPNMVAFEVIEEFPLPRLKKASEYETESYRRETQRHHLQELLDQLEERAEEKSEPQRRPAWLDRQKYRYND